MSLPLGFDPDEIRRILGNTSGDLHLKRAGTPSHRRLSRTSADPDEIILVLIVELELRKADIRRLTHALGALQSQISTVTVSTQIHVSESALSPP